jgi:hypothetical protein
MTVHRTTLLMLALAAALPAAGCGSSDKPAPTHKLAGAPVVATTGSPASDYNPTIRPADFTNNITNPYWPLKPGTSWTFDGTKDGAPQHVEVSVTNEHKQILGVDCVVVRDVVTVNSTLHEKTVDWYAQDRRGNIWYFGEDTKEYTNGVVSSTFGTWEAGVDNAKPGMVIQADPKPGGYYRQEYRPGLAEDQAKVIAVDDTEKVPMGTFSHVVVTKDIDPLNPDKVEHKWYAKGIGPVHVHRIGSSHQEDIKLVSKRG